MTFFNPAEPIWRRKQEELDTQDRCGLLNLRLGWGDRIFFASDYSRIDQVSLLWGAIAAGIFITAQFAPISWHLQAIIWTALSGVGLIGTTALAHFWVRVERLEWLLYSWIALAALGVALTDGAIFWGWGWLLMYVCHLWLGLGALGYFLLGFGVRSRALCLAGCLHVLGIGLLWLVPSWQFLATGLVMAVNSFAIAETQWDMRPPLADYACLSAEEKAFNQLQFQRRQMASSRSL